MFQWRIIEGVTISLSPEEYTRIIRQKYILKTCLLHLRLTFPIAWGQSLQSYSSIELDLLHLVHSSYISYPQITLYQIYLSFIWSHTSILLHLSSLKLAVSELPLYHLDLFFSFSPFSHEKGQTIRVHFQTSHTSYLFYTSCHL